MFSLDPSDPFQARAQQRLLTETVAWLTTVGADGTPQPNPIWFIWDGAETIVIYSVEKAKPRHVAANPRVALHFNTAEDGDDVVIFTGSAVVDRTQPPVAQSPPYLEKYAAMFPAIGYTVESYTERFSAPIVITLEKVRGF